MRLAKRMPHDQNIGKQDRSVEPARSIRSISKTPKRPRDKVNFDNLTPLYPDECSVEVLIEAHPICLQSGLPARRAAEIL
jgi:hypothetical protein